MSKLFGNDSRFDDELNGFIELFEELNKVIRKVETPLDILEVGAEEFTKDLLKLPKPISRIKKSGYTHLITTFSYRRGPKDIAVGWGKYYGRMVEYGTQAGGTKKNPHYPTPAQPHLRETYIKNKEKYYKKMLREMGLER